MTSSNPEPEGVLSTSNVSTIVCPTFLIKIYDRLKNQITTCEVIKTNDLFSNEISAKMS